MLKNTLTLYAAILVVLCSGCIPLQQTSTYVPDPITSFVDPAFRGRTFQRVAVVADTADLQWRSKLESNVAGTFRQKSMSALEGSVLIPPTRQWNDALRHDAFIAAGIDAYLTLEITESGAWTKHIPTTTSTTMTHERKAKPKLTGHEHDTTEYEEVNVTTTTKEDGGYDQITPWTRYTIKLVDVATGQVAWMAMNSINGTPGDRLWTFSQEIVAQLQRDGLVKPAPVTTQAQ